MARSYSVPGSCSTLPESATIAYLAIVATAATQPSIYEINSGASVTPANNAAQFNVTKGTSMSGAQGAITPVLINAVAGTAIASVFTAANNYNPATFSGVMLQWAQNQNTAYRWVASSPQRMMMVPSTANAGAGLIAVDVNSTWANWVGGFHVEE